MKSLRKRFTFPGRLSLFLLCMALTMPAHAQTITMGQTTILSTGDSGNANKLDAFSATLSESATIDSISFYTTSSGGSLYLGVYDNTGPNGGPGALKATTAVFTPGQETWNTENVTNQVVLAAGTYWLAFLPSSSSLGFNKETTSGSCVHYTYTFGALPSTFSTSPTSCGTVNFSLYATLTPTSGSPTISLSPTSLSFSATAGGGNPSAQNVTVSNSGGGTLASPTTSTTYHSGSGWLTVNCSGSSAPYTCSNQPATGSLAAGTYTATVNVSSSGASNSPQSYTVSFTVNPASSPAISLSPTSLSFSATQGGGNPSAQNVTVSNSGGGTLASPTTQINYSQGSGWLTVNCTGSQAPYTCSTQPTTGSLSAGTYNATVQVSSSGASNSPQSYTVAFTVNSNSTITIGQTTILSTGDSGNANKIDAFSATLSENATIDSMSFYVTTAAGQLVLGIYDATGPSGGPGALKAYTNAFTPTTGWNTQNVVTPVALTSGTYWLAYLPSNNSLAFVKETSSGSCVHYTYTFGALPSTYSTSPTSCGTVNFSFYATLTPTSGSPTISLSPTSLSFSATAGGANPSAQNVTVSNSGGGTLAAPTTQINYSQGSGWLSVNCTGSQAPYTCSTQPATGSLAAGTYNATVQVSSSGATNTPQSYTVAFTVNSGSVCTITTATGTCGPYSDTAISLTYQSQTQNDVWNPPSTWSQALFTTDPGAWYAVANFPTDASGAVHTYPSMTIQYCCSGSEDPTLDSYSYMYSSFSTTPDTASTTVTDAGYDNWMNNWANEVMFQTQLINDSRCTDYFLHTVATSVSFGGTNGIPTNTWNLCQSANYPGTVEARLAAHGS